ncbi:MAG: alpha-galactosidase [Bacteroidaceae bacterium]|nr:alpha-galactosidase [Bacteroidaceae bacterium]
MKKLSVLLFAFMAAVLSLQAKDFIVSTNNTSLLLTAKEGEALKVRYYGDKVTMADFDGSPKWFWDAYPVFGTSFNYPSCLQLQHADGNQTLALEYKSMSEEAVNDGKVYRILMKDKIYPLEVTVCYQTHNSTDVIETWTEITNNEKKTILLNHYDSGFLPIHRGDVWTSHLHGTWANETRITTEKVEEGGMYIANTDGTRNAHTTHPEIMISLDGKPQENSGRCIGAVLCWNGNYKLRMETTDLDYHLFFAGIDDYASQYHLDAGKTFTTPKLALTYSDKGLGGVSRNIHKWARNGMIAHGNRVRDILLNSWEGVYLDIKEKEMAAMMDDIAALGGELFVMDDGWFGDKYPRNVDNSSLGDWVVDTRKLPNGIEGLLAQAKKSGVKFGIWIEPEMSNTVSELYEKHPDWALTAGGRPLQLGRGGTQFVLDMTNPKVQDFVVKVVDDLFGKFPELYYIKWDANCPIANYGSPYLPKDRQSNLYVDYVLGLDKTLKRIREKYPDKVIQACGSGGGRTNYGAMPYFDEFWVSDNTDALQRVYLQWGTSYFYPAISMAQHVSTSPNHNTQRNIPIKFRFDVASSGRLGMEMQPKEMNEQEFAFSKKAIAEYKRIRETVQFGDQYRLISPYDNPDIASLMYVSESKDKAVFFAYKLRHYKYTRYPLVRMAGLDPNATYKIREINVADEKRRSPLDGKSVSGRVLMNSGIDVTFDMNDEFASRVFELVKV